MSDPGDRAERGTGIAADAADRDVLGRILAGELDALEELYDRYRTMAYSIALRITTDAALAEDVVQDAFLGAWRNANRYLEGRGSVKTWLLSIVHHRAVDAVRRRSARSRLGAPGSRRPVRVAARGARAGVLQRPHAAGDRSPDRGTAGHCQEPD